MSSGIAMNAIAHTCAQLGTIVPALQGTAISDASGSIHAGVPIFANTILYAKSCQMSALFKKAISDKTLTVVDYPKEGYYTVDDNQFCEAISKKTCEDIEYWAIAIYGDTEKIMPITKKCSLWSTPFEQDRRRCK